MRFVRGFVAPLLLVLLLGCDRDDEGLPEINPIPRFTLTNQSGAEVSSDSLKGRIWIADFIFTSCPTICPVLTRKMRAVQERYAGAADEIGFLSFSVDPRVDTPERLREFGTSHQADFRNWHFLTGDAELVQRTVKEGFMLALGDRAPRDDGTYDILHSGHFVLIDTMGVIRGYYPTSEDGLKLLADDIRRLRAGHE